MNPPAQVTTEGTGIVTVKRDIINSAGCGFAFGVGAAVGIWLVVKIATAGMPAPEGVPQ